MKRRGGFTLLEILLVMGMVFVLAAVVVPRFSDYVPSLRVKKTTDRLFAWARKARSDAALTGLRQRLVIDTQEKKYWLEVEARPFKDPGVFTIVPGWEEEALPDEVQLETLEGLENDPDHEHRQVLEFRPDGSSEDATITVANDRGDRATIKVVAATSRVYIEPPPEP